MEFILDLLNIRPQSDPMHEGFWYIVVQDADNIRKRFAKLYPRSLAHKQPAENGLDSAVAGAVWEIMNSSGDDGLGKLHKMIKKFVLPALTKTQELVGGAENIFSVA